MNEVIAKIDNEVAAHPGDGMIYCIGEVLKGFCKNQKAAQIILETDKTMDGCMKVIYERAKAAAKSNQYCMDKDEVTKITKEYYGITDEPTNPKVVSLFDVL